jgi:hypothetical protein
MELFRDGQEPGPTAAGAGAAGAGLEDLLSWRSGGPPTRAEARGEPGPLSKASGRGAVAGPPTREDGKMGRREDVKMGSGGRGRAGAARARRVPGAFWPASARV